MDTEEGECVQRQRPFGVPAAPNESTIRGRLLDIQPGPEGLGFIWKVEVTESQDIDQLPNFTRPYVGQCLSIYVHPDMKKSVQEADLIEARLFFQGDESGGAFFLCDDDVRKL